jgi:hypothetical protein
MSWRGIPHSCPRCGTQTTGAWSEGGARWALCQGCLEEQLHEARRQRREHSGPLALGDADDEEDP